MNRWFWWAKTHWVMVAVVVVAVAMVGAVSAAAVTLVGSTRAYGPTVQVSTTATGPAIQEPVEDPTTEPAAASANPTGGSSTTGAPATVPPGAQMTGSPLTSAVPSDAAKVVHTYLDVYTNAMSAKMPDPWAWRDKLSPVVSDSYRHRLEQVRTVDGTSRGIYQLMHAKGWVYRIEEDCTRPWANKGAPAGTMIVQCSLRTTVERRDGRSIDSAAEPEVLSLPSGPQRPPALRLIQQHGQWVVDQDVTDRAG